MKMDYKQLGFKCGIEIHQQLEGEKLFCRCPTIIRKEKSDFSVTRNLRVATGEMGEVDAAASHEAIKQKYFVYHGYEDTTCLVELDEEPPRELNSTALKTCLEVTRMLNCTIIDEIQFMRKTVIDGSNTSGFQRTALVGVNGWIEVDGKKIRISSVCLEEEACQVIERNNTHDVYNLSRLGIPLIEIATEPDMHSPKEAEKVAGQLGMILRSTGQVKRGIGTIRQDVNLSIKNGARVEIKGFQDLKSIPKVIDNEIKRQIAKGDKLVSHVRKAESDYSTSYLRPMPGAARMYPETDVPRIIPNLSNLTEHKLLDETVKEWEEKYKISLDIARILVKKEIDFDYYVATYSNILPKILATHLTATIIELRRKHKQELKPSELDLVFETVNKGKIPVDAIVPALEEYIKTGKHDFSKFASVGDDEIKKELEKVIKDNPKAPIGALMGIAMAKLRGKAEGQKVMKLLKELQ